MSLLGKSIIGVALTPIIMSLFLIQGLISDTSKIIECIKYKIDANINYVKYDDIPYLLKPNYLYYNSYKDKIAVIVNNKMCFAHKYINKLTNKVVYVDNNGKMIDDNNIEQYKIGILEKHC